MKGKFNDYSYNFIYFETKQVEKVMDSFSTFKRDGQFQNYPETVQKIKSCWKRKVLESKQISQMKNSIFNFQQNPPPRERIIKFFQQLISAYKKQQAVIFLFGFKNFQKIFSYPLKTKEKISELFSQALEKKKEKNLEYNFLIDTIEVKDQKILIAISLFPFLWKLEEKESLKPKMESFKIVGYDDVLTVFEGCEINKCLIQRMRPNLKYEQNILVPTDRSEQIEKQLDKLDKRYVKSKNPFMYLNRQGQCIYDVFSVEDLANVNLKQNTDFLATKNLKTQFFNQKCEKFLPKFDKIQKSTYSFEKLKDSIHCFIYAKFLGARCSFE